MERHPVKINGVPKAIREGMEKSCAFQLREMRQKIGHNGEWRRGGNKGFLSQAWTELANEGFEHKKNIFHSNKKGERKGVLFIKKRRFRMFQRHGRSEHLRDAQAEAFALRQRR